MLGRLRIVDFEVFRGVTDVSQVRENGEAFIEIIFSEHVDVESLRAPIVGVGRDAPTGGDRPAAVLAAIIPIQTQIVLRPRKTDAPAAGVSELEPCADSSSVALSVTPVKKPTREERQRMCVGKRRYRSQGDALDAAALAGVERRRNAYLCPLCRQWHLTSS